MSRIFHLHNERFSYAFSVLEGGWLAHLYAGARLNEVHEAPFLRHAGVDPKRPFSPHNCALDWLPQEYPAWGLGDMRTGALTVIAADGCQAADLRFVSAAARTDKPKLPGLPATFGGPVDGLDVLLRDALTGLEVTLQYSLFQDCDALARSVCIRNAGDSPLVLRGADSLCLDLPDPEWDLITLNGAWARERSVVRRRLAPGEQGTSTRTGASSLQTSPFAALVRPEATETAGECFGAALVYSGSFHASASLGQYENVRLLLGLNPQQLEWRLAPGESFQTPEAVLVYSRHGLDGMSRQFHHLWQEHLLPRRWVKAHRPVLLNSWEAAYFDFDEEKLLAIAGAAADAGATLFVLDDGWFGHRDDDTTSLGDWDVDCRKLPGGLQRLGNEVRALGLQFGIWMEPEMVSPDSDLFRAHPDWCIHIPGRSHVESRNQLILDMSRPDVQDFVVESVSRTIRDSGAAYLKWDMNRNFTNLGSALLPPERQGELAHRYILGLYAVLERLTRAFPELLIEGCASGGGRLDAGMLYFEPQIWCSDDTDALNRCRIQYGTSLVFPPSVMGSHVSAVPNHQTGCTVPLETRFNVALMGAFGYELDPRRLTAEEREAMRAQIRLAEETQDLRLSGRFHRLLSPFAGSVTAWIMVAEDQREALFTVVRDRDRVNMPPIMVRLRGLSPEKRYRIAETGEIFGGDELMGAGLLCPLGKGEGASLLYHLKEAEA